MQRRTIFGFILAAAAVLFIVLLFCLPGGGRPDGGIEKASGSVSLSEEPALSEAASPNPTPTAEVFAPAEPTEAAQGAPSPAPETESPGVEAAPPGTEPPGTEPPEAEAAPQETEPPEAKAAPPEEVPPYWTPVRIGGKTWLADGSGGFISHEPGLCGRDGYTYCFREDGSIAADEIVSLDGVDYAFDGLGRWMSPLRAAVEACATAEKTSQLVVAVDHNLTFWEKAEDGSWRLRMETYCGYGANGLVDGNERIMGSRTTPIGAFPLTLAFGTGENPGTEMVYRQITEGSYWSSEEDETFNTWVESASAVSGEHLIDYYQYKYAVNIGFNLDPIVYSRGCAIFLHVKSTNSWHTAGCVSLSEEDMLTLLLMLRDGAHMIIVPDMETLAAY